MNKARRKWIEDIINRLEEQKEQLDMVYVDEMGAYEALPESIQDSERGEAIEENANDIDDAASDLEDIIDTLREVIER